ncbi:hypothetical protein DITRI_Ditri05aG0165100 [Diplodiscus trichospermus]
MAKAKTQSFKSKTKAIKTRLVIFSLLQNKKFLMSSISHKLNALMGQNDKNPKEFEDVAVGVLGYQQSQIQGIVICNKKKEERVQEDEGLLEDKYPDLTLSFFDSEEMDFEDPGGSVIDIVKNSKEDKGEEFRLEDEIGRVADLFIRRFHRQMRIQKQQSLKRHQEMLQ